MKHFPLLEKFCTENNIKYSSEEDEKFALFYDFLIEKNKVMNLTAITDHNAAEIRHFIDSVEAFDIISQYFSEKPAKSDKKIIDIGTGAGFPGMPLAILLPEIHFILADSLDKRISFINEFINMAGIGNISAVHGRAEDLGHGIYRENNDICTSRAVAAMPVLLEYSLPLVKVGGKVIMYKSGNFEEELAQAENALSLLGGKVSDIKSFILPGTDIKRSIIVAEKIRSTPEKYPRRAGKPAKSPL